MLFTSKKERFSVPKRQLPLQAELVIYRLRWEGLIERQCAAFDNDDELPHAPSADPLSNPQSGCTAVHVS